MLAPMGSFPSWGIEFQPPAGWKRIAESDFTIVASYVPDDGAEGSLRVIAVPIMQNTLGQLAANISKRTGGKISATTLGGRSAQLITGGRNGENSVIAQRNGYIFEMFLQQRRAAQSTNMLDAIRQSWQWIEQVPPAKTKTQRPDPIVLLDAFTIRPPECIRPWPVPKPPPGHVVLAAIDIGSQRFIKEMTVNISMPAEMQGVPLKDIQDRLSVRLAEEFKTGRLPGWSQVGGRSDHVVCQTLVDREPGGKLKRSVIKGLVSLDAKRVVLVDILMNCNGEDELVGFAAMAPGIVGSIEPLTPPQTAVPSTQPKP